MATFRRSRVRVNRARARALAVGAMTQLMVDTMRVTQNRSKVLTPVDQGILRAEQIVKVFLRGTQVVGTLTALPSYALPVHEGWHRTRPILPVHKKALRFKVGGRPVIVAAVNSPASYPGRPFMYRAMFEVMVPRGFRVQRVHVQF